MGENIPFDKNGGFVFFLEENVLLSINLDGLRGPIEREVHKIDEKRRNIP